MLENAERHLEKETKVNVKVASKAKVSQTGLEARALAKEATEKVKAVEKVAAKLVA